MTGTSEQGNHKRRFQADLGNQGNQGNQVDPCGRPWFPGLYTFLHDREAAVEAASSWRRDGVIPCDRQQGPIKGGKDNALETL